MRRLPGILLLLIGCSSDTPKSVALSDVAGTWDVTATTEAGDTLHLTYIVTAGQDSNWKVVFPAPAKPISPRIVSVAGDSIVTQAGPYPSTLHKGVMVITNGVFRLVDGKLIGHSVAHYNVSTPDSVRRIFSEGIRR